MMNIGFTSMEYDCNLHLADRGHPLRRALDRPAVTNVTHTVSLSAELNFESVAEEKEITGALNRAIDSRDMQSLLRLLLEDGT